MLYHLKRDLLLKTFSSSNQDIQKIVLTTSLKKGLPQKESLLSGAFFLEMVSGQKAIGRRAKKASASFKLRQGDLIGWQVTLRNKKMFNFFDKLRNSIFPTEGHFFQVSDLYSFFEFEEQVLPEHISIHISVQIRDRSSQKNNERPQLYLSGLHIPVNWLKKK